MGFTAGVVNAKTHRLINELRQMASIIEMMRQSETSIYTAEQLNRSLQGNWVRIEDARANLEELGK